MQDGTIPEPHWERITVALEAIANGLLKADVWDPSDEPWLAKEIFVDLVSKFYGSPNSALNHDVQLTGIAVLAKAAAKAFKTELER